MIPHEAKNDFDGILSIEMFEMDRQLSAAFLATSGRLTMAGHTISSAMALSLTQDASNSLKARAQMIYSQLIRCLGAHGVHWDDGVLQEATNLLRENITIQGQQVRSRLGSFPVFAQLQNRHMTQQADIELAQEPQRQINRLSIELRLAAAASRGPAMTSGSNSNVTIHGPVGVVQTGDSSQATVTQHIDAGTKTQLISGLQLYLDELSKPDNQSLAGRDQIRDLVVETKAELEKPKPNSLKVSSGLRGIVEATKFIGSLGPAYRVVKPLLGFFGIHLP